MTDILLILVVTAPYLSENINDGKKTDLNPTEIYQRRNMLEQTDVLIYLY
jgi:hypothetical protein